MAYDEEQVKRSRVVIETPTAHREVVRTVTAREPVRRGIPGSLVAVTGVYSYQAGPVPSFRLPAEYAKLVKPAFETAPNDPPEIVSLGEDAGTTSAGATMA